MMISPYHPSIRTTNNHYKQQTLSWTVSKLKNKIMRLTKNWETWT